MNTIELISHLGVRYMFNKIISTHTASCNRVVLVNIRRKIEFSGFFLLKHNRQTWVYTPVWGPTDVRFRRNLNFPTEYDNYAPRITRVKTNKSIKIKILKTKYKNTLTLLERGGLITSLPTQPKELTYPYICAWMCSVT